jgi:membrane-associated protease RseP (regulator of RpoE activity)
METEFAVQPESSAFSRFMAGSTGRLLRAAFGASVIGTGLFILGGTAGLVVAALGLVPVAAGTINLCPVAPLWGGHFLGAKYCTRQNKSLLR